MLLGNECLIWQGTESIPVIKRRQRASKSTLVPRLNLLRIHSYLPITIPMSTIPFYGTTRQSSRIILTLRNAITALKDPTRADAVAAVGELTGDYAIQTIISHMKRDAIGRQILKERPIVSKESIPYDDLIQQAKECKVSTTEHIDLTFGQAYGMYLLSHGFDPDGRDKVRYMAQDSDEAYIMTRYRQCHDFWHALTGLPPTVSGELGLKWLELFQTKLPMCALSCGAAVWTLPSHERQLVWDVYLPWARRTHQRMGEYTLMNVYYEMEWDTPLSELQERLKLEPAPRL